MLSPASSTLPAQTDQASEINVHGKLPCYVFLKTRNFREIEISISFTTVKENVIRFSGKFLCIKRHNQQSKKATYYSLLPISSSVCKELT